MVQQGRNLKETPTADARIVRSKEALRTTLLRMLEHNSLEQISIRDIAKAAGVGHATFYRHFPTKEALLDYVAADEIRRMVDLTLPLRDTVNSAVACKALCQYVYEHRALWGILLNGGAAATLKEELLRISHEVAATHPPPDSGLPSDLVVVLVSSSIYETLAWWLRQIDKLTIDEVADIIDRIIIPSLGGE